MQPLNGRIADLVFLKPLVELKNVGLGVPHGLGMRPIVAGQEVASDGRRGDGRRRGQKRTATQHRRRVANRGGRFGRIRVERHQVVSVEDGGHHRNDEEFDHNNRMVPPAATVL